MLPYTDLMDWSDIAQFVSHYVTYDTLDDPLELPEELYAPQTVLKRQRGHCFDLSTLLCSLLIGSGYDAFVVSGYASKEVCTMDLSYTRCPLIEEDLKVYNRPMERSICRYTVRPPKMYASEYMLRMKMKQEQVSKVLTAYTRKGMDEQKKLREAPPKDDIRGWRVHSWVMVRAGRRDIKETFFIEPSTGFHPATDCEEYQGIESLWNHRNYYVNVQQGNSLPNAITTMTYNIEDSRDWEYVFSGQDLHYHITAPKNKSNVNRKGSICYKPDFCDEERHFDLPPSWTLPMNISVDEYDVQYPNGKTSRSYKNAVLETFSRYLLPNGLIKRLTVYSDLKSTKLEYTKEYFFHRHDLLTERFMHHPTGKTIETFLDGREDFLREHHYFAQSPGPESNRTLHFSRFRRLDLMYKREEGPEFIKEWYDQRPDRKIYKETIFGPSGQNHEYLTNPGARLIESVTERYSRDKSVAADEDICEITFSVWEDEIDVVYHVADDRIAQSTRHFSKPDRWWDDTVYLVWKPELHYSFEADVYAKPLNELKLYMMMVSFLDRETKTRAETRQAEKETRRILQSRIKEESSLRLIRTCSDAPRIPETRAARLKEKTRLKDERMAKKADTVRDYLEPYMQRLGLTVITNKRQANRIRENIMFELKMRFSNQLDMMREDYENVKQEVQILQDEHARGLVNFATTQINAYEKELTGKMFKAHILEERINELKVYAPIKYRALYDELQADPRMMPFM